MCLISDDIESVSNTNILVAPNYNNTRQLVVYSNYINNISESNAMVLPIPLPQSIQFIDLSGYKNLFDDCAKCFYNPHKSFLNNSFSTKSYNTKDDSPLPLPLQVFNVGSYQVSIAMNLEQIKNVDSKVFILSPTLKQTLETFYYQPYWGFIICKLNSGPEMYHPIAYSHQIIDSKIYIPTRHYHQEVKWADANKWALGTHIDPKYNPLNTRSWNNDNINMSPMFRTEQFGLINQSNQTYQTYQTNQSNEYDNFDGDMDMDNMGIYSSNIFETPTSKFNNYSEYNKYNKYNKYNSQHQNVQLESNSIAKMSSRYNNLSKTNKTNKTNETNNINEQNKSTNIANTQTQPNVYKNIADDWSHSIYLINLNFKSNEQIKQMNTCKEIWDNEKIFNTKKINFDFGRFDNFEKIKIEGTYPNIDLVIQV